MFKCPYCNNEVIRQTNNGLKQKSCGCIMESLIKNGLGKTHGGKGTRLYNIWKGIKVRCYNKKHHSYKNYGMKRIKICNEWIDNFAVFKKWAIESGYKDNLTIDRIDKHKNYSPDNCQWISLELNAAKDRIKYTEYDIQKIRWLYICCNWTKSKISRSLTINRTAILRIINYRSIKG